MIRKNKKIYIILIALVIFSISIGYAAINRTLNITGNSEIKQNTWNIYFDNILVTDGSVSANLPVIDTETKSIVNFSIVLNKPGDFYEFTVDIKNSGTIDAMLESIERTLDLTEEQKKYINYTITYHGGGSISEMQIVPKDNYIRIKVRIEYRIDITEQDLPSTNQNIDLSFKLNYIQADKNGKVVLSHGYVGANGDINEIGTIVTIGTEKFYTIGTDGENVKLLSMYNLYVGSDCIYINDPYNWEIEPYTFFPYGEEATGMQNENMLGQVSGQSLRKGVTLYSEEDRGLDENGEPIKPDVYYGSTAEGYVSNYKSKLEEKFDVNITEARLITYEELNDSETIGCVNGNCTSSPSWIYTTSYWTSSSLYYESGNSLYVVLSNGLMDNDSPTFASVYGIRPVILIPKIYFN